MRSLIRYAAYPVIAGGALVTLITWTAQGIAYWPAFPLLAAVGILAVAALERIAPHDATWLHDQGDLAADLVHNAINLSVLLLTVQGLLMLAPLADARGPWPAHWPIAAQVLLAGAILDVGLYAMHRVSHRVEWLWRLHAIHHSPERLYWLNGERRHPLHAVILAGPGLLANVALGAPAAVIDCWLTFLTVHLAFQHANLDYTIGPLRSWIAVAEVHRLHHHRDAEHVQVNYGEFWMIWDRLFGTARDPVAGVSDSVGLHGAPVPMRYLAQLRWPFVQ